MNKDNNYDKTTHWIHKYKHYEIELDEFGLYWVLRQFFDEESELILPFHTFEEANSHIEDLIKKDNEDAKKRIISI